MPAKRRIFLVACIFASAIVSPNVCAGDTGPQSAPPVNAVGAPQPDGTLTREKLIRELGACLVAHFNLTGELQVDILRPWAPPSGVSSEAKLEVLEFPTVPASSMLVRGRIVADGKPAGDVTLVLRASLWREAWAARLPIAAGAVFEPSALEARRVDLLRERDAVPVEQADSGYVLARAVPAGRLLTWRDLARRPLVRKGELVEVEAGEGMLLITMKAVAMENGARGETITLRNPESRKNFSALVVHENRVQVRF